VNYTYIKTRDEMHAWLARFEYKKTYTLALDVEAELNQHAYGEKLCLVQIFDGTENFLIDPLDIDSATLKHFFENRYILKIMYDASSDSSLMKNAHDIVIKSILDLRPAIDLLNYEKRDLHSVIAATLGVTLTQKLKFQQYNWVNRPIGKEALEYAINDVSYLFQLKDAILKKLAEQNLMDAYIHKNLQVQNKDYHINPEERYKRIKWYYHLPDDQKAVFKKLFEVREKHAKNLNLPANNIINNMALIEIARRTRRPDEVVFPRRFKPALVQDILKELRDALV
jgi:ribonuclease D